MTASKPGTNNGNLSENPSESIDTLIARTRAAILARLQGAGLVPRHYSPTSENRRIATTLSLASLIDHTLLKPEAGRKDIRRVCDEAIQHGFATVCLNSAWIRTAAELLRGSSTLPIAVVGFPLGASTTAAKAFEAKVAIADGAREIDMVIALGPLKEDDLEGTFRDIQAVVEASSPYPVKVIIEASLLSDVEKISACLLSQLAGAAFVKTSTGFSTGGAVASDIALLRKTVGPNMGVKASGGIRTHEDAQRMIDAGANRIGASTSVAIVTGQQAGQTGY